MEKHISPVRHLDETKAFVGQFLDRAFCHLRSITKSTFAEEADLTNSDHSTAFTESNTADGEHKVFGKELAMLGAEGFDKLPVASSREVILKEHPSIDFPLCNPLAPCDV